MDELQSGKHSGEYPMGHVNVETENGVPNHMKGDLWAYSQACNKNTNWRRYLILIDGVAHTVFLPTWGSLKNFASAVYW